MQQILLLLLLPAQKLFNLRFQQHLSLFNYFASSWLFLIKFVVIYFLKRISTFYISGSQYLNVVIIINLLSKFRHFQIFVILHKIRIKSIIFKKLNADLCVKFLNMRVSWMFGYLLKYLNVFGRILIEFFKLREKHGLINKIR